MDEFFNIEQIVGEVAAVIGFQYDKEPDQIIYGEDDYEKFPEPEVVVVKPKKVDGDGSDEEEAQQEEVNEDGEEGEKKVPKFEPEKFKWTMSNRKPKNLPQLFSGSKGINALSEVKTVDPSYSKQHSIA